MSQSISAPMPTYGTPFLKTDGRTISEPWWNLLWALQRRGGGADGIDLVALTGRVDDLDNATAALAPSMSLVLALIGRVVELERSEMAVVSVPPRVEQLPDAPVGAPGRGVDDAPAAVAPMASVRAANGELKVSNALTDSSGTQTATLTNAPVSGNPTKWIPINDNGTIRYAPTWS
ncbi:MAG: hypothetical protein V4764_02740 [Burkholderia sp.]